MRTDLGEIKDGTIIYEPVVVTRPEKVRLGRDCRIDSFVKLEGGEGLVIGDYVHIASFAHIGIGGGFIEIGDFAAVASGGKVISGSNKAYAISMSAAAPAEVQAVERSLTILGRYSCVLTNATVLPGVKLGEGAVLAAGGVATKDIPAWEIWGGVPAKFMASRVVDAHSLEDCPFKHCDRPLLCRVECRYKKAVAR